MRAPRARRAAACHDLPIDTQTLSSEVDRRFDDVVDRRRWFHAHPELAFAEHDTTTHLRDGLRAAGLTELPCPTETGALFALDGGRPGRTVLVRADIDALPVQEPEGLAFRSETDGLMHACGHDAHSAIGLGVAELLAARAEDLPGRYVFLFQPAEEAFGGATKMIAGGALETARADRAVGLHVAGYALPPGYVFTRPGVFMAAATLLDFRISGPGGHGAMMGDAGNVLLAAATIARRLSSIVDGLAYDKVPCACSAGMIRSGRAPNVVPMTAQVMGTLRTYDDEQHRITFERLDTLVAEVAGEYEVEIRLDRFGHTPAVKNDRAATETVMAAAGELVGADNVLLGAPVSPSDDMSEFLERVPGCYFMVGAQPKGATVQHHSADFRLDEQCLAVGMKTLAAGAIALAERSPG